jgi:hypothetical protein
MVGDICFREQISSVPALQRLAELWSPKLDTVFDSGKLMARAEACALAIGFAIRAMKSAFARAPGVRRYAWKCLHLSKDRGGEWPEIIARCRLVVW